MYIINELDSRMKCILACRLSDIGMIYEDLILPFTISKLIKLIGSELLSISHRLYLGTDRFVVMHEAHDNSWWKRTQQGNKRPSCLNFLYHKVYPMAVSAPTFYGLPKVHKTLSHVPGHCFRPSSGQVRPPH